ncbi:MAG TPA: TolC family protein [Bryobacteraceae bacterium]|nr:TolC family protein [Bryobacteraceae bacterium]
MVYRTFVAALLLAAGASAQMTSFPKPSYFRETFQKTQTKVELKPPARLNDFVADGKLELSLQHYLELVMANNTDVQLQLLSLEMPRNAILTAWGVFDPTLRAAYNTTRSTAYVTNPSTAIDSVPVGGSSKSLAEPYSATWNQTLTNGLQYSVGFTGQKTSSSAVTKNSYNANLESTGLAFNITQPLIRNRGTYVNKIPIMQAQSSYKISEFQLRSQLITLINTAETAYWNVISARENLKVQEKARDTADAYLKYMQQQLDLGALSPLDIYNPQQNLAAADLSVSQAKFALATAEEALRHQVGADLDPQVRNLPVVLTESVDLGPADSLTVDREQAVSKGLNINPAVKGAVQKLDVDDLGIQSAKNGLLPSLNLTGGYSAAGRGGSYINGLAEVVPGGIGDSLGQMFGFGYPTYQAGLTLTLPVRSKAASAAMANAMVQKKMDVLTLRNQEQAIRLNVLTAVVNLEGAKEQLKLAQIQQDFAKKNLDAENQKYLLGTEINQNVINAQQALVQADSAVATNQINVRKNLLNLLTQTGELLDARGIVIR